MSSSDCIENGSFSTASSTSPCSSPSPPVSPESLNQRETINCTKSKSNPEDDENNIHSSSSSSSSNNLLIPGNEETTTPSVDWQKQQQQQQIDHKTNLLELFVLSESGKPIYSYTTREDIVTLLPLCQALVNCFQDTHKDTIRFIVTRSGLKIIFSQRTPLIFVVVTHTFSGIDGNLLINQIHAQLVSVITEKTLRSVFEQRATFDLRRLLTGNEKMVHILIEQGFIGKPIVCRRQHAGQQLTFSSNETFDNQHFDNLKSSHVNNSKKDSQFKSDSSITYGYISSLSIPFSSSSQSIRSSPSSNSHPHQVNYHRSYVNRALIPVYPLNQTVRDSITNAINSSISSVKSRIAFGLLLTVEPSNYYYSTSETNPDIFLRTHEDDFPSTKILAVSNYNSKCSKLSPLDMQLIQCLVMASESQLKSVESLWLPLCLPRIDASAFMHGHISYLNNQNSSSSSPTPSATSSPSSHLSSSPQLALILLTTDKEDFHNCQMVKDNLGERLNKIKLTSPPFSDLNIPCLQYFWYMTLRSQSIFRSSLSQFNSVVQISPLIHFVAHRMLSSRLKIFWLRSDRHKVVILGWHSPTFQLYAQLEPTTTKSMGLNAAQMIVKWIKKEEDKLMFRDY
ncbi:protein SAND-like [Panonychus citri]|uniref:protein SAND-like n=1 Tax=Panonychus citri TaxID=50023 RepID=UPI0023076B89|nr:protein SAND-like [Panonychus citri]